MKHKYSHLPNILTMARIVAIPFFVWMVVTENITAALFIFAAAALTDWLDGFLARRWQVVSNFGKIMDPLADKLLVLAALAGITWSSPFRLCAAIFFIILIRELVITILREVYKKRGIIVAADKLGKLKTVMQMTGLVAAYTLWAWVSDIPAAVTRGLEIWFWAVAAITVISGLNYLKVKKDGGIK
ncbi:MAG: CDP-diacylglycerol--glycerol-3-phosphate 3-phosphatidyltransferase [Candidatus Cloacimonetes bacterium]|nr:CDP-diacylglycerol--glycerol-3-phosphate 3-phosphatidyltransferase [Candidatus Cloacimonadota bacterium]